MNSMVLKVYSIKPSETAIFEPNCRVKTALFFRTHNQEVLPRFSKSHRLVVGCLVVEAAIFERFVFITY